MVCGVALIENGYEQLADTYVLRRDQILEEEPKILKRAISMIPQLPLRSLDCLIVYELGKDVSGTSMDPAIIGRSTEGRTRAPKLKKSAFSALRRNQMGMPADAVWPTLSASECGDRSMKKQP